MPRTRLTHSLEVAQIGRGIAEELGCDPDVVDTGRAGARHRPPAVRAQRRAGAGRRGAAVRRVRGQRPDAADPHPAGAEGRRRRAEPHPGVLGRVLQVPVGRAAARADAAHVRRLPGRPGGVRLAAARVRPEHRRCLEAQVMDWSDDVAYSVHDLEDGIRSGRIVLAALGDPAERAALAAAGGRELRRRRGGLRGRGEAAARAAGRRRARSATTRRPAALVALKRLTSELVGRFATAAVDATQQALRAHAAGPLRGRPRRSRRGAGRGGAAQGGRAALRDERPGPDSGCRPGSGSCSPNWSTALVRTRAGRRWSRRWPRHGWRPGPTPQRLRVVIDQVAMLTDQQAVAWHARCIGQPGA